MKKFKWIGAIGLGGIAVLVVFLIYTYRPVSACELPQNEGATRIMEVPLPKGYERVPIALESYGEYLRELPLKPSNTLYLYTDAPNAQQCNHYGIVDLDRSKTDLQQCADAVMRTRAEYLRKVNRPEDIHFNFTSGDEASWKKWAEGWRVTVKNDQVKWHLSAKRDDSYANFRAYLDIVFAYAGTASLEKELLAVPDPSEMQIGDVFIYGGHPGHIVQVADIAEHPRTEKKVFLLIQGNTPAQDIHLLKNPHAPRLSPWYSADFGNKLRTTGSVFYAKDLMRFTDD